jgi:hypothetical protein
MHGVYNYIVPMAQAALPPRRGLGTAVVFGPAGVLAACLRSYACNCVLSEKMCSVSMASCAA